MIEVIDLAQVPPEIAGVWTDFIADHLRQSDRDELAAAHGLPPLDVLRLSVSRSSHGWVVLVDHRPVMIFGAAPTALPGAGLMWMLATDGLAEISFAFARNSRRYFSELGKSYHLLWNYIDPRNTASMRWLKWCGFQIIDTLHGLGPNQRTFHLFARSADV